jgi:PAS domain-containing protein
LWSEETFRIFEYDRRVNPTVEPVLERIHPEGRDLVLQQIDRASLHGEGLDFEHRLQLPDGSVKHVRVTAHRLRDSLGNLEFVGSGCRCQRAAPPSTLESKIRLLKINKYRFKS